MTPRERFLKTLHCEPIGGQTPTFELEFQLTKMCIRDRINLEDTAKYDTDGLLPEEDVLFFFHKVVTQKRGFDPDDVGCAKVFYVEKGTELVSTEYPSEVPEEYNIPKLALSFESKQSYPSFEELECYTDVGADWDEYDKVIEKTGCDDDERCDRHKLLGSVL